ncbi:MAG: hypothetical protein ACI4O7_05030 [Aristaeellaceae bacterium]
MKKKVLALIMAFAFVVAASLTATVQPALAQDAAFVLSAPVQFTDLVSLYDDFAWNGGYYHSSMSEDGMLTIVNCCAAIDASADSSSQAFREAFTSMVSEYTVQDYADSLNQSLTDKFGYPVYDVTFTTGANEDTCLWRMVLVQTDTHAYAYAFRMYADGADYLEPEFWNAVSALELLDSAAVADDPSARGESLEDVIVFLDTWYQYGDLNAESICINGDGTWAYYNAVEADGSGGYLYADGTFLASGTTMLQLYSTDGSLAANVSLDEYGELMLTPVSELFASVYADAAFIRASESIAYEAQPLGE